MKIFSWFCLGVFVTLMVLGLCCRFICVCDGVSNCYCFKCGHWAYQCPRFTPKRGPLFSVPSGDCPTCGVNNAVSPSTFCTNSITEGGR